MSTITLIAARSVAWTERMTEKFIQEALAIHQLQPWGYIRHMGKGIWKVLVISGPKAHWSTNGQSQDVLNELRSWGGCILLTDASTVETARSIITEAGHRVDIVRYPGLLRSG